MFRGLFFDMTKKVFINAGRKISYIYSNGKIPGQEGFMKKVFMMFAAGFIFLAMPLFAEEASLHQAEFNDLVRNNAYDAMSPIQQDIMRQETAGNWALMPLDKKEEMGRDAAKTV
jgi:hypothetical protein